MRNVVILYTESGISKPLKNKLFTVLTSEDNLLIVYELQHPSTTLLPLIGDLSEIRYLKAKKTLDNWFKASGLEPKTFMPVVLEGRFNFKQLIELVANDADFLVLSQEDHLDKWKKIMPSTNGICFELVQVDKE